jgi:hypothetical protein
VQSRGHEELLSEGNERDGALGAAGFLRRCLRRPLSKTWELEVGSGCHGSMMRRTRRHVLVTKRVPKSESSDWTRSVPTTTSLDRPSILTEFYGSFFSLTVRQLQPSYKKFPSWRCLISGLTGSRSRLFKCTPETFVKMQQSVSAAGSWRKTCG